MGRVVLGLRAKHVGLVRVDVEYTDRVLFVTDPEADKASDVPTLA